VLAAYEPRGCRESQGDASAALDALVRLGGPLFASFVGAERYSLTESGRQALLEA
jgi:hypothetical protein